MLPVMVVESKELWRCHTQVQARPPMAVTNAVSWRSEGIRYKKNEVMTSMHAVCMLALCKFCTSFRSKIWMFRLSRKWFWAARACFLP